MEKTRRLGKSIRMRSAFFSKIQIKCRGIPHYKLIDWSTAVTDAQASKTDVLNTFQLKNLSLSLQYRQ